MRQMLEHAREAVAFARDRSREDLDSDRLLELALTRLLEIVGEAATRVSTESRERVPDIPWPRVVALRNRLIHVYDSVDRDVLWRIVTSDLPPLIMALERTLHD
jgi:uncharacterized protein with HEPN domain